MAWYDQVWDKLQDYTKDKIRQLENLYSKGLSPQKANHQIKLQSAINEEDRRGIVPWDALNLCKIFKRNKDQSMASLPTRRSQRLTTLMAAPTTLRGSSKFRYLLNYSFDIEDSLTGERITKTLSMGLSRLDRWGKVLDRIEEGINTMQNIPKKEGDPYEWFGKQYVSGSVVITGFYSLNN